MLDTFPWVDLVGAPTPLERMSRIGEVLGHPAIWVKRDDCMPLAFGGNKVRSLEFWIGEAKAQGSDMLVVAGALPSNQCRLTAAAGAKLGIEVLVLYAGDSEAPLRGNAMLTELLGADIRRLGPVSEEERGALAQQAMAELRAAGRRPYLIGDPFVGALGYVRAAEELTAQDLQQGAGLRHIVLPGSMGVTEAGLILGAALLDRDWRFHLVSVEYDAAELTARLTENILGAAALMDQAVPTDLMDRVEIHTGELGGGYGVVTEASLAAARTMAANEALMIEQVYVAKTFAGLLNLVRSGAIPKDEAACILHTGGTPSLFEQ
ncbi:pyridoxal-phosphate dependent enzyme [Paracoccus suum]|uniref:Pyridoxal-phosphate dependent enzyme n=1 Tax=Paracoccus suum TaxID=2259340 RepID=A0A344PLE5_9RHOB|nr:pyridoxal-phosphate dependent enzyme [Paracoccus suum]AXC50200.1 pyridoxal-phosphate dependent enzyme [Paracoccus suum]